MDQQRQQSQNLSRTYTVAGELVVEPIWTDASDTLKTGTVLDDKFEILSELGRGGMGVVYRVKHKLLDKEMALKTFNNEAIESDAALRFEREARAIGRLRHQNIVQIFDFGTWGQHGTPYYAMELLQGESLAERLERTGPLSISQAVEIFIDVARALDYAASLGIIHRDIKPANIFLASGKDDTFTVKIVDFGIAKLISSSTAESKQLTSTGLIFGSPLYMAPEQALGSKVTVQSDIYSCGCALYEAVTGATPLRGANALVTMQMHITTPAPPLPEHLTASIEGKRLNTVLSHMLAKELSERYQSGAELASALQQIQMTQSPAPGYGKKVRRPHSHDVASAQSQDYEEQLISPKRLIVTLSMVALVGLALILSFVANSSRETQHQSQVECVNPIGGTGQSVRDNLSPITSEQYYSIINADGSRDFHFPKDVSLGTLESPDSFWQSRQAKGDVPGLPHLQLGLKGSDNILSNPELLDPFRPDDLTSIQIGSLATDIKSNTFTHLVRLTQLKALTIANTKITTEIIDAINKFKRLESLKLQGSPVSAEDLLKLDRLDRLSTLAVQNVRGVSPVIAKLKRAPQKMLKELDMSYCFLTDEDLEQVAEIDSLTTLKLSFNDFGERGITALQRLPHLTYLAIEGCDVSPSLLKKFKKLGSLTITHKFYDEATIADLKKTLNHCSIKVKTGGQDN